MTDEGSADGSVMSTRNLVSMILLLWLTPHDASAQGRLDVAAIKSILVTSPRTTTSAWAAAPIIRTQK